MGRGQSSKGNKKKGATKPLDVIENQDYIEMRTAAQIWTKSSVKTETLQELADLGPMRSQSLAEWKEAGEHRVPAL